jgi:hypothetical protein
MKDVGKPRLRPVHLAIAILGLAALVALMDVCIHRLVPAELGNHPEWFTSALVITP